MPHWLLLYLFIYYSLARILIADKSCGDKKIYKKSCVSWKSQGFCHKNGFIRVMMRRCKETCGFCPDTVAVSKRKPQSTDKASNLVMSVCDIRNFDSVITISDHHHGYSAYYFKVCFTIKLFLLIYIPMNLYHTV